MADRRISELPSRSTVMATDEFLNLAGGINYRSSMSALNAAVVATLAAVAVSGNAADLTGLAPVALSGNAADLTGLALIAISGSADDLTAGIVPDARISGAYSGFSDITFSDDLIATKDGAALRTDTADGTDNKLLVLTGGGGVGASRGSSLALYGNERAGGNGAATLAAGDVPGTSIQILGGYSGATAIILRNQTPDAADTGYVQIAGGGAINNAARGAYLNLFGNEHASLPGRLTLQAGDTSALTSIVGGASGVATQLVIRNNTTDAADDGSLMLTSASSASNVRGAHLILYGNEHATQAGRFDFRAGLTATTSSIIGGSGAAAALNIYLGTTDGTDDGQLLLSGGGGVGSSVRGAWLTLYGNEHATNPGLVDFRAGDTGTLFRLLGGQAAAANITIRNNHLAGGNDTGTLYLSGSGNTNDVSRGSYVSLYGNNHASLPGRLVLASGNAATVFDILGGAAVGAAISIRNQTADGADSGILYLAAGGQVNTATRGAFLSMYGNEAGGGFTGRFVLSAGDAATVADIVGGGGANPIFTIRNGTADGSDNGYTAMSGGGSLTSAPARGAYIQLFGNDHPSFAGRFTLQAGDASSLTQIIGGIGATILSITNATADASDTGALYLSGGGTSLASSRGAYLQMFGNEHATLPGRWNLVAGITSVFTQLLGGGGSAAAFIISNQTPDGSDNGYLALAGGGAHTDSSRGAWINIHGNEHASVPGGVQIVTPGASGLIILTASTRISQGAAAQNTISVERPAGQLAVLDVKSGSTGFRWRWTLADNTAEGGSDAGSNMSLSAYSDAATLLGTVFSITRSSRVFNFTVAPLSALGWQSSDTTVASLPAASAANKGTHRHVTDANSTTFGATVAGGGSNVVPVFSTGAAWIIG